MPSAGDGPALTGTATFRVLKHSWKGVYERQLLLSPSHLRTIDEQGNRTNSWTSSQIIGATKGESDHVVDIHISTWGCGMCTQTLRFTTEKDKRDKLLSLVNRVCSADFVRDMVKLLGSEKLEKSRPALTAAEVVVVPSSYNLDAAFQTLLDKGIHSAPVEASAIRPPSSGGANAESASRRFVGYLDQRDMLSYAVLGFRQRHAKKDKSKPAEAKAHAHGFHASVSDALIGTTPAYLARRNPIHMLSASATWLEACLLLSSGALRRVGLDNGNGGFAAIVSQSSAVEYLLSAIDRHPEMRAAAMSLPIFSLGAHPRKVFSCTPDQMAIDAFELMEKQRVSGIAIVDSKGQLLGGLSAKDLRPILEQRDGSLLSRSLKDYLGEERVSPRAGRMLSLRLSCTVHQMLLAFDSTRSHRLFMVDGRGALIGVVSLVDALKMLLGRPRACEMDGTPGNSPSMRSPARSPLKLGLRMS